MRQLSRTLFTILCITSTDVMAATPGGINSRQHVATDRSYSDVAAYNKGGSIVADGPCKNKVKGDECVSNGAKRAVCEENVINSSTKEKKLTCTVKECKSDFLLWVQQKSAKQGDYENYQSQGICVNKGVWDKKCASKKECETEGKCKVTVFQYHGKTATDQSCFSDSCNSDALESANALKGFVINESGFVNCQITKCKPEYKLNSLQNKCDKVCTDAVLKKLHATNGKNVNGKCVPTDCETGYGTSDNKPQNDVCKSNSTKIPGPTTPDSTPIDGAPKQKPCTPASLAEVHATDGYMQDGVCVPTSCGKNYHPEPVDGKCVPTDCSDKQLKELHALVGYYDDGKCVPTDCEFGYTLQGNTCIKKTTDTPARGKSAEPAPEEEVEEGAVVRIILDLAGGTGCEDVKKHHIEGTDTVISCYPSKSGFDVAGWTVNGQEVSMPYTISAKTKTEQKFVVTWKPSACTDEDKANYPDAVEFDFQDGQCIPTKCKNSMELDGTNCKGKDTTVESEEPEPNDTEPVRTECTSAEKAAHPNATAFEYTDGVCKPTACKENYKLQDDKCVEDEVKKAEDKYKSAKENENSLANRTLGSLSMAATGIGGMELARGLAEQNADKAAEDEMSTYISTFQCKIGDNNKYYNGGEKTIETPGANQLIGMYQEYVELAASLKERKAALGMKPGIEAEVVLDKAATGLYDEVGHGIENGTYASLYRASKGNETDAKKLDDAKSASKKRVIGGGVAAGAGAVGGMVGNMIINGKKDSGDSESGDSSSTGSSSGGGLSGIMSDVMSNGGGDGDGFASKLGGIISQVGGNMVDNGSTTESEY